MSAGRVASAVVLLCVLSLCGAVQVRKDFDYPFDRSIEKEAPSRIVNFFDPRVFNATYYIQKHPALAKLGVNDTKSARMHWTTYGIKEGLTACANFSAKIYLEKNADIRDMYGATNYPFAIIHYLMRGVHETFRETGGPLRLNVYHPKVFDWRWYLENNVMVKQEGAVDEETAKIHWLKVGLPKGLQASPHFNVRIYAEKNSDVMMKFDPENYPAALAHWLDKGHSETWRQNGGTTCEFWARWCHNEDSLTRKVIASVPLMPKYNTSGAIVPYPPEPVYGGFSVEINGRDCSDFKKSVNLAPGSTRVEHLTHIHFLSRKPIRKCNIFIRHYINIQTRIQNKAPPELYLTKWEFDDTVPKAVLDKPMNPPAGLMYSGFSWEFKPNTTEIPATFKRPPQSTDWNFGVAAFRLEDLKGQPTPDFDHTVKHLTPVRIYTVLHHFQIDPTLPVSGNHRNADGSIGASTPTGTTNSSKPLAFFF